MKTFVKILCVLICLLMVLSAFSACKNQPDNPPDNNPSGTDEPDPKPDDPTPKPGGDLIDDIMKARYPGKEVRSIIYPEDLMAFVTYINSTGGDPSASENVVYYLGADIDLNPGWSSAARVKNGKYLGTSSVPKNVFPGVEAFYGIFDGNGHTISGLYIADELSNGDSLGFFRVLAGTVKDLKLDNTFVEGTYVDYGYSADLYTDDLNKSAITLDASYGSVATLSLGAAVEDVNLGAIAGKTIGDAVVLENLSVRANVVFRADDSAAIGGLIGSVESNSLTATGVEFHGKAALVAADNTYPAPATDVTISQFIGNANGNDVSLDSCVAAGSIVCAKGADGTDEFCARGASGFSLGDDCRIEAAAEEVQPGEELIEIYVAEDLLNLFSDSTYEGEVIRLMADIDFNPEWSASTARSGEAVGAPTRFWEGIPYFKGTFDGNGHTIYGLCRLTDLSKNTVVGGIVDVLGEGAVIKNLRIENSAVFVYSSASSFDGEVYLGGIAAKAEGTATIDSVAIDMDLWVIDGVEAHRDGLIADIASEDLVSFSASANFGLFGKLDRTLVTEMIEKLNPYSDPAYEDEIIEIYTANDLLTVMWAAQDGETFAGKTIRLMRDIDLNPRWNISARLNANTNRASFGGEPMNVWYSIPVFSGMFDGNGYSISGIYSWRNAISINNGEFGGFIDTARNGAIIKNLVIKNSLHVVNNTGDGAWGSRNIHVGGLIGRCDKTKDYEKTFALTVSNVYVDMDVVILCSNHSTVGGILAFAVRHGDEYTSPYNLENVVFAGRIINTDYTLKVPFTSPKDQFAIGQIVADTNWGSQHKLTNVLAAGEIICGNTTGVNPIFGAKTYSGVTCSNVLIGRRSDLPTSGGYNSKTNANDATLSLSSWNYNEQLGFYLPASLNRMIILGGHAADLARLLDEPFVPSETADSIHVTTAKQLISLAQSGEDFLGKTIYLDNDIDFNPGWSAATSIVDGKVVFPEEPEVVWYAFANFRGTIDGQGHTIRGLYSKRTVTGAKGNYGGLIDTHSDGAVRNLAVVNSIHIVENTSGTPAVHDLCIGGLAGEVRKTQVKTADKGKNKYALGNSEHYGLRVNGFFTDMEVWLVSNSNALVGGLLGYINGNYTIQHLVYAGKVGNTNAMTGGSASYAASSGAKNLALGQIVGCNNWFTSAYLEDALVIGDIITGTTSSYIHTYVGADDKVSYRRCSDKLFATLPESFPEDAAWTLSDAGFMVPNSLVDRMTTIRPSLAIVGTTVTGITLKDEKDVVGLTLEDGVYSVTIPEGITTIAADAFVGLPNIVSVTLPATLTNIGASAFEGQTLLTSIKLPDGLSIIGKSAFAGCTSLGTIDFPMSLTSIGDYAFDGCTALQLNTIPRKVNYIGINAFHDCPNLTYLEFGYDQSVSLTIRNGAFDNTLTTIRCTSKLLVGSVLPDFLRSSLTEIRIMSGSVLETNMFRGFTSLTTVKIPTITEIRASAFNGCTSLTTLEIPASLTLIEEGAFRGLSALTAYVVEEGSETYVAIDGNLYTADGAKLLAYAAGKTEETFVLPETLAAVGSYAFDAFESLTSITYQGDKADLTKNIEFSENAFGQPIVIRCNDGLTCLTHTVVIDVEGVDATCTEDGVAPASHCSVCGEVLSTQTVIEALGHDYGEDGICTRCGDEKASDGLVYVSNGDGTCYVSSIGTCTDVEIVIPNKYNDETVVGIGEFSFANTAITSVKIPASVTSIGTGAFANCSALKITTNTVATGNTVYTSTANGIFKDGGATLVRLSAHLSTYTLPAEVTAIEDYAFAGCVKLVTLNASTSNPNYKASSGVLYTKDGTTLIASKNATPITVAAGTKYIANGAFYGCNKLKKVTIASTVESIGDYAFYGCSLLDSVVNNATDLKHVGTDAFTGTKITTPPTVNED